MKKKLGVIGGMGPEATAYFYEEVIRHTKADCDQEHLDMTILSHASMPDRTKAIQSGECDPLLQAMEGDLKVMEQPEQSISPSRVIHRIIFTTRFRQ